MEPPEDALRRHVEVGAFAAPLGNDAVHVVGLARQRATGDMIMSHVVAVVIAPRRAVASHRVIVSLPRKL